MSEHTGLPVAGYQPQSDERVQLVNCNKNIEEACLRVLDALEQCDGVDRQMLKTGRTQLVQAFMWINRSIFRPSRVKLPGDE